VKFPLPWREGIKERGRVVCDFLQIVKDRSPKDGVDFPALMG
jgi:hypothetical protein